MKMGLDKCEKVLWSLTFMDGILNTCRSTEKLADRLMPRRKKLQHDKDPEDTDNITKDFFKRKKGKTDISHLSLAEPLWVILKGATQLRATTSR